MAAIFRSDECFQFIYFIQAICKGCADHFFKRQFHIENWSTNLTLSEFLAHIHRRQLLYITFGSRCCAICIFYANSLHQTSRCDTQVPVLVVSAFHYFNVKLTLFTLPSISYARHI